MQGWNEREGLDEVRNPSQMRSTRYSDRYGVLRGPVGLVDDVRHSGSHMDVRGSEHLEPDLAATKQKAERNFTAPIEGLEGHLRQPKESLRGIPIRPSAQRWAEHEPQGHTVEEMGRPISTLCTGR